MKTIAIASVFLITSLVSSGQSIPLVKLDSVVRPVEFYLWTYYIKRNDYSGKYWLLDFNSNLFFGRSADYPALNIKKLVGKWELLKDYIVLTVTDPKEVGLKDSTTFMYKIFQVEWTTNTGFTDKFSGEPLIFKSIGIILSDSRDFNVVEAEGKLNEYLKENLPSENQEDTMWAWDNHGRMVDLVTKYFTEQKIVIGIKQYKNGELWIR